MFRHDEAHTACSSAAVPATNQSIWTFTPESTATRQYSIAESSPALVDNCVFVGAAGIKHSVILCGRVYCLNAYTGSEVWHTDTDGWISCSPAVANDNVYVADMFNFLSSCKCYCLDQHDGHIVWAHDIEGWGFASPTVYKDNVFVGTGYVINNTFGKIYCFDAQGNGDKTTDLVWEYPPQGQTLSQPIFSSPAVANDRVYFCGVDSYIYCFDATPGDTIDEGICDPPGSSYDLIWTFKAQYGIRSSPTIVNERLYVGSGSEISNHGTLYCLDVSPEGNGSVVWENTHVKGSGVSSPTVANNCVYMGCHEPLLYCLDALTGNVSWTYETIEPLSSSPSLSGDLLIVGTGDCESNPNRPYNGSLLCLNTTTQTAVWEKGTKHWVPSCPALAKGLVVISSEPSVICFSDNDAPNQPQRPSGKIIVNPEEPYEYSTSTTDPDGDAVRYGWDWNGDAQVDEWTSYCPSGETVTMSHAWPQWGIKLIRVKAEDIKGFQSDWSKPLPVVTLAEYVSTSTVLFKEEINAQTLEEQTSTEPLLLIKY